MLSKVCTHTRTQQTADAIEDFSSNYLMIIVRTEIYPRTFFSLCRPKGYLFKRQSKVYIVFTHFSCIAL